MRKRVISILMIACMVLGLMTACGGEEKKGDDVLVVGLPQHMGITDYENNALTKYIEESIGAEIKFEFFSSSASEYMQQLSLRTAGGEKLPDVIWGFMSMDLNTMKDFGKEGYFIDLTELIEKHAPNYKAQFEKLPLEKQTAINRRAVSEEGAIYGMPFVSTAGIDNMQNEMYINQKWLDRLGLKAPTNIDELYTVLKAFKENDPNQNGEEDEIPLLGRGTGETDITGYIINAFTYFDTMNRLEVVDGEVIDKFTTKEYRDSLIYMNKLCDEGLLSEFCFTLTAASEYMSLITPNSGVAQVGVWCGNPELMTDTSNPVLDEYTALRWLDAATEKGGYSVVREPSYIFCSFITSDCKNTKLAMKFLDLFYKDETTTRVRHGEKGVDWIEEEGVTPTGDAGIIKILNDNAFFEGNSTWGYNGNSILTPMNYYGIVDENNATGKVVNRLASESWEIAKQSKNPEQTTYNLIYSDAEYLDKMTYDATIAQYVLESKNLFITGKIDPSSDEEWNKYLSTFDTIGLDEFMKIMQNAYDNTHMGE